MEELLRRRCCFCQQRTRHTRHTAQELMQELMQVMTPSHKLHLIILIHKLHYVYGMYGHTQTFQKQAVAHPDARHPRTWPGKSQRGQSALFGCVRHAYAYATPGGAAAGASVRPPARPSRPVRRRPVPLRIYIYKLPIDRPRGCYVILYYIILYYILYYIIL